MYGRGQVYMTCENSGAHWMGYANFIVIHGAGFEPQSQALFLHNLELMDFRTLAEYEIQRGSTLLVTSKIAASNACNDPLFLT
jgi:hypothetical protein